MNLWILVGLMVLCNLAALAGNNAEQSVTGPTCVTDTLRTGPDVRPSVVAAPPEQRKAVAATDVPLRLELRSGHLVCFSTSGSVQVTVKGEGSEETLAAKHDERGQLALRVDQLPRGQYVATAESEGRRCTIPFSR
jgi:hypothetical protein